MTGGYISVLGPCAVCRRLFTFNPMRVPSVVINGVREPICRPCIESANAERARRGLPLFTVRDDSYEAAPAEDVIFGDD